MVVQTGEKNFKCEICDKAFACKNDFETHMAVHTGKRNLSCKLFDKEIS
jgi:KRAB domain-containing zinc finger protein